MKEKKPLTNVDLTRTNLRISFACLVYGILGVINAFGYTNLYWKMSRALQVFGFIICLILLVCAGVYGVFFAALGIYDARQGNRLKTLPYHLTGLILEVLLLLINIRVVTSMFGIMHYGYNGSSSGILMPFLLSIFAILNLIMDLVIFIVARKKGIPVRPPKVKSQDISMAKVPANTGRVAFCPNCGSPVDEGALFCGNCGHKLPKEGE